MPGSREKGYSTRKFKKTIKSIYGLILLVAVIIVVVADRVPAKQSEAPLAQSEAFAQAQHTAAVHIINVGQGDCVLLEADGEYALVDAGESEYGETVVQYLQEHGIAELKYAVITHLHTDHMGGMSEVLSSIKVGQILLPDTSLAPLPTNRTIIHLLSAIDDGNYAVATAERGQKYLLGDASINIVSAGVASESQNDSSIGILFVAPELTYLATGDGEADYEEELLSAVDLPRVDIFKAAHHGSSSSNTNKFLQTVDPAYVVICCGKDNRYGHPHKEPMARFAAIGATIFRTDQNGNIVFHANKGGISVDIQKEAT